MKKKFIVWLKKYVKWGCVKTGELVGGWGIFPNYDPTAYCEAKAIRWVSVKIVRL